MGSSRLAIGVAVVGFCALLFAPTPAGADVIDPPGACSASGHWQDEGVDHASADLVPSDLIEIPQRDTVTWAGNIKGFALGAEGPRRQISGEVEVDVAGVGSFTVDSWGKSSVRYANEGEHDYDVPDVLLNVKMRLHGEHREAPEGSASFTRVCGGSVYVKVSAGTFSNPLSIAALVGMAASGAGLASAGVVRKRWAFEDTNPG